MRLYSRSWIVAITIYVVIFGFFCISDAARLRKARRLNKIKRKIGINFSCTDRPVGYYADVEFGCRVFHICDTFGRRVPMRCPTHTLFNQLYRVCDWADNVDCQGSAAWYHLNEIVYDKVPDKKETKVSPVSSAAAASTIIETTDKSYRFLTMQNH